MGLQEAIGTALTNARKLRESRSVNEANTKALVIEPLLAALGWSPYDLDDIGREVRVFDGTFLDYAVKLDGQPRIYVEAKALGERLDDPRFVAQTVNYANNDGIVWCVLTDGVRWKVYKTNESLAMDQKQLFEVDLSDTAGADGESLRFIRLLSRDSVTQGELDRFGERVFTDGRVRAALTRLATEGSGPLHDLVARAMGHPEVPREALRRSVARVLDAPAPREATPARSAQPVAVGPAAPPRGQEYPLEHHLGNKSALINELFGEVNALAMSLGADVTRRVRKHYVGYFRGKRSFVTAELQMRRVIVYLSLDPATAEPWDDAVMRDVTGVGHFGMGDIEYSLTSPDRLEHLSRLVARAYDERG